ncbi:hypothetical protein [Paenibacillus agaridevorans]|uniref:hypothetical protein n=1 Tax=Paenibacillus agaridevorans TaxID=171404 RepID=UPI001BE42CA8|nr:hypothetical protein [Paenibacillus agaridevorans]
MNRLDIKQIISITDAGLNYQDNEGQTHFIDFHKYRINFSKFMMKENDLTEEDRIDLEQRTNCIALRDAFTKPMYIEFFSEPPIRIEFKKKLFKDPYKEFRKLVDIINEHGWKTFDMG